MAISELLTLIRNVKSDRPSNVTEIYFVRKQKQAYRSFKPQMSADVQQDILEMILPVLEGQLERLHLVNYNPIGVADEEMEELTAENVPQVNAFLTSINEDELLLDEENLDLKNIAFYCLRITYNGNELYLFRQFSKLRRLRKGYLTRLQNNQLVAMEKEFIGIDEIVDIVLFNGRLYILNHISLERVFNYRDEYLKVTHTAMDEIFSKGVLANIEQFSEDCSRDVRAMKRITDIMAKDRLPLFFENFDKVPDIVSSLGMDIQFNADGKLIYRDKGQLFPIIYLMSDAYFKSLLAERTGIAKTEEAAS